MPRILGSLLVAMVGRVLLSVVVGPFIVVVPLVLVPSSPPWWPV